MVAVVTAEQVRAGRAMLKLTQSELAGRARISTKILQRIEAKSGPIGSHSYAAVAPLIGALETAGIRFIPGGVSLNKEGWQWPGQ